MHWHWHCVCRRTESGAYFIHKGQREGQRGITADTALRLARYFGTSAQMWLHLQSKYDLAAAEEALGGRIAREVLPRSAA
jgi:plasmid maintenance system antidote protein VapI